MKWHLDEQGRLVITVTKKEQRFLQAAQHRDEKGRCEPPFDSDRFMHDLFDPMVTNGFKWLPEGCTDDLTSAPMLGVLGDEMPGPDDTQDAIGMGLLHVGRGHHKGRLRRTYQPVLRRWAFMDYALTSPQRELADTGRCVWEGGDLWGTQEAAEKAVAEVIGAGLGQGRAAERHQEE
jgi:hypothetical protein